MAQIRKLIGHRTAIGGNDLEHAVAGRNRCSVDCDLKVVVRRDAPGLLPLRPEMHFLLFAAASDRICNN